MKYYLKRNGVKVGPYTPQELKDNDVVPLDLVCPEGSDKMVSVSEVKELKPFITTFEEDLAHERKMGLLKAAGSIVLLAAIMGVLAVFTTISLSSMIGVVVSLAGIVMIVRFRYLRDVVIAIGCVAILLTPETRLFVIGLIVGVAVILAVISPIVLFKYVRYALTGLGGALVLYMAIGLIDSVLSLILVVAILLAYAFVVDWLVYTVERQVHKQYAQ